MKISKKNIVNHFHEIHFTTLSGQYHPPFLQIYNWINLVLKQRQAFEVSIVFISKSQIKKINYKYRKINKPTDVLSFNSVIPAFLQAKHKNIGELIISPEIVNNAAKLQKKKNHAHWAHIIIHGTLHLLGHDHTNKNNTSIMENKEVLLLKQLGFNNPYE
jgi:probable rRNA maturation factor